MRIIDIIKKIVRLGGHLLRKLQWTTASLTDLQLEKTFNITAAIL